MSVLAPFAYDAAGSVYVCGDGPEVFVYSGANDAPMWKQLCDGILVGVGVVGQSVYTLDTDGRIDQWRSFDGNRQGVMTLECECRALAVHKTGNHVVVGVDQVLFPSTRGHRTAQLPSPVAAAIDSLGARTAVGTSQGYLYLLDIASGSQVAAIDVGAPIAAVAWSPKGRWIVAAGRRVLVISGDLAPAVPLDGGEKSPILKAVEQPGTVRYVAASFDGALVACDDGGMRVIVYETHTWRQGASVEYQRDLGGLMFGPGSTLGIGLEFADANRLDVMTGSIKRTQPGLGRGGENWFQRIQVDQVGLRGAVAAARVDGQAIAEFHEFEGPTSNAGRYLLFGGVGCVVLGCVCSGVLGVAWVAMSQM